MKENFILIEQTFYTMAHLSGCEETTSLVAHLVNDYVAESLRLHCHRDEQSIEVCKAFKHLEIVYSLQRVWV